MFSEAYRMVNAENIQVLLGHLDSRIQKNPEEAFKHDRDIVKWKEDHLFAIFHCLTKELSGLGIVFPIMERFSTQTNPIAIRVKEITEVLMFANLYVPPASK